MFEQNYEMIFKSFEKRTNIQIYRIILTNEKYPNCQIHYEDRGINKPALKKQYSLGYLNHFLAKLYKAFDNTIAIQAFKRKYYILLDKF